MVSRYQFVFNSLHPLNIHLVQFDFLIVISYLSYFFKLFVTSFLIIVPLGSVRIFVGIWCYEVLISPEWIGVWNSRGGWRFPRSPIIRGLE